MLSKTAEYALRAVVCMGNQPGVPVSADRLAEHTKVPRRYLAHVLQDLAAAGLVRSRPGPGGGYELSRDGKKISILDVVDSIDPFQRIQNCPLGLKSHTSLCPLHAELDRAYATTQASFSGVTIQDVIDSSDSDIPLCDQSVCDLPSIASIKQRSVHRDRL